MGRVVSLGGAPWSREDLRGALEEFSALYQARPIRDNAGGMRSPHALLAWLPQRPNRVSGAEDGCASWPRSPS
jgi:hypothetical protein